MEKKLEEKLDAYHEQSNDSELREFTAEGCCCCDICGGSNCQNAMRG